MYFLVSKIALQHCSGNFLVSIGSVSGTRFLGRFRISKNSKYPFVRKR